MVLGRISHSCSESVGQLLRPGEDRRLCAGGRRLAYRWCQMRWTQDTFEWGHLEKISRAELEDSEGEVRGVGQNRRLK